MISVGSTVGNYKVVSLLGQGAMARVYLAEHPRINKRVAIKVIHHELATNKEMVSRFFTEARAASQINHENVVDILDFGQTPEGDNFMVMEYLDGQTISSRLKAAGRLEIPVALHITMQIVDALSAAHQKGVVHRDLKPDNIFLIRRLSNPDYVKILDFGLAKLLIGGEVQQHKTSSGSVLGTPHYMAPEQCEGKSTIDGRADLYSVGCIMYQMVTGELPFPGDGFAEVLIKHLSEPPPRPSAMVPNMPASVEKLILHCLAKKVEYRFQSAPELLQALYDPEGFSQRIGNDPIAICGPMPGQGRLPALEPPQMATMMGGVPPGLTSAARPQSADATSILSAPAEQNRGPSLPTMPVSTINSAARPEPAKVAPPTPQRPPTPAAPPSSGNRFPALGGALPSSTMASPPPFPVSGSGPPGLPGRELATVVGADALPSGPLPVQAARSSLAPAAMSSLYPLPEPPKSVPTSAAATSQLAERPVVASSAAPQMATMIGEMPPAAVSALYALAPPPPRADSAPPKSQPGPPPPNAAGSGGFRELAQATAFGLTDGLGEPAPAPTPAAMAGPPASPPIAGAPRSWPPSGGSHPGSSQPSQPSLPPPSRPGTSSPGGSSAPNLKPPSLNERLRALPPVQKFLMLPLPRRLFLVRVGAAVFAGLIALLFLLLLLPPRHATIIVRSDPDQAAISSEGQSLGETPITVELKRNAVLKIALHKDGYEDADEEISADGEHVVLIKLNKKAAEPSGSAGKPSAKNPDGKTPGKPDGKKDPNRGGKKNDASDPVKPDPIKPDPVKPDPVKPDPVKPDPVKPDPVKPNPIKPDPVKPDPVKPDPVKPDPAKGKKPSKPVKGGKKPKKKIVVF